MKIIKVFPIIAIALSLIACSLTVNMPTVETGITQTLNINEPFPTMAETSTLSIEMGAGSLTLTGGANNLVEGTVTYNVESWKPEVIRNSNSVTISQKTTTNVGIPNGTVKNQWDLKVGPSPIEFKLTTGASESNIDLSGISITGMSITDGASKSNIRWDSLNPVEMSSLNYKTGASEVELVGLGYANVRDITFDSGVGAYTLDFTGGVQKDTNVTINSGMSEIKVILPEGTRARVVLAGGLSNIDASGTWTINGNAYETGSSGPLLTISVNMAVGNLQLIQK